MLVLIALCFFVVVLLALEMRVLYVALRLQADRVNKEVSPLLLFKFVDDDPSRQPERRRDFSKRNKTTTLATSFEVHTISRLTRG